MAANDFVHNPQTAAARASCIKTRRANAQAPTGKSQTLNHCCRGVLRQLCRPDFIIASVRKDAGAVAAAAMGEVEALLVDSLGELDRVALNSNGKIGVVCMALLRVYDSLWLLPVLIR